MRRRWIIRSLIVSVILLFLTCTVALGTADSHHVNLRWILWKHHLWPYDQSISLRYLNVDVEFRQSLKGQTKAQIHRFFPLLFSPDQPVTSEQKYYSKDMHDKDWWWIDDSNWAILFERDRVQDIRPIKG